MSDSPKLGPPLKPAQHLILLLLAEKPSYGVELLRRLDERSRGGIRLNAGSLYRLIARLSAEGLIEAVPGEEPRPELGAPKKRYGVTPRGRRALADEAERQAELVSLARSLSLFPES